jgi:hypothetical protein
VLQLKKIAESRKSLQQRTIHMVNKNVYKEEKFVVQSVLSKNSGGQFFQGEDVAEYRLENIKPIN